MADAVPVIAPERMIDLIGELVQFDPALRRQLTLNSDRLFAQYYFDTTLWSSQERWIAEMRQLTQGCILAPVAHGKTEAISKVLATQEICKNRNIRILIVSESDDLAKKNVMVLGNNLRYNTKLLADFGVFYDTRRHDRGKTKWTQHQIYVVRDKDLKDPTVQAIGMGSAITGGRFDIIILDDVISVKTVRSDTVRRYHEQYIETTIKTRLDAGGVVWSIGTRKHADDLYNYFLNNPFWKVIVDRAIIREPKYELVRLPEPDFLIDPSGRKVQVFHRIDFASDDRGEVLAPDKWTMEMLLKIRAAMGSELFNREYQNVVHSDATAVFKIGWLQQCRQESMSYVIGDFDQETRHHYLAIIQGADTSLVTDKKKAEALDSDFTVIWTVGLRPDGSEDLLGLFRERGLTPSQVQDALEREYWRFVPDYLFLEDNAFGAIHAHNLINDKGLKLVPHTTTGNKHDLYQGVPSLSVLFEQNLIRLPYRTTEDRAKTDALIVEFHGLGSEPHDDIVMAGWIAETGVTRFRKGQHNLQARTQRPEKINRPTTVRRP